VPSLVTASGYFRDNTPDFAAEVDEVERAVRMQIDHALARGGDMTHPDAHMGCSSQRKNWW